MKKRNKNKHIKNILKKKVLNILQRKDKKNFIQSQLLRESKQQKK